MTSLVKGLHHVTAISGAAQKNLSFYADALGLRFVKKTVNFDDPSVYHLYYGDALGRAGTVMTFFPWEGARPGRLGAGQTTITAFAAPVGALGFWTDRLPRMGAHPVAEETVFGERRAVFQDPDGLLFAITEVADDPREPWVTDGISADVAIRGFRGVTLAMHEVGLTGRILREALDYEEVGEEPIGAQGQGRLIRLRNAAAVGADVVDLHVDPALPAGVEGAGSVHHIAFNVADRAAQSDVRAKLMALGQPVTPQIDRDYFFAIYTRTPSGVLFEVATEEPGFTRDEAAEALGGALKLPSQHEPRRAEIEAVLPPLDR